MNKHDDWKQTVRNGIAPLVDCLDGATIRDDIRAGEADGFPMVRDALLGASFLLSQIEALKRERAQLHAYLRAFVRACYEDGRRPEHQLGAEKVNPTMLFCFTLAPDGFRPEKGVTGGQIVRAAELVGEIKPEARDYLGPRDPEMTKLLEQIAKAGRKAALALEHMGQRAGTEVDAALDAGLSPKP